MSRIFLSHSSANNAEAVALRDWLRREGWDDIFLDLDPNRGIAPGEKWERALNRAASRCEAVLFLVSRAWLASGWCVREFNLAHKLNKRMFGVLIDDIPIDDLPVNLTSTWQLVQLCSGRDHVMLSAIMPVTGEERHLTYSAAGLAGLKIGLQRAGLDARFFAWPPETDLGRPPYRGLKPLEAEDAGIFLGRDAAIVEVLDHLRGLREGVPPRFHVILGASGAGKSSFLRAGLLPRLDRDDLNFLPLPILRPERAAITGDAGLIQVLERAFRARRLGFPRADIRAAVENGAEPLAAMLAALVTDAQRARLADDQEAPPPILVLPIDQGEELFGAEGSEEAEQLLALLSRLVTADTPGLLVLFTIRSDHYERLQTAKALEGIRQDTFSLPPLPRGSYQAVIEGPVERLRDTPRALKVDPKLTQALLADIESGGGRDALPLLAFTLERLYLEYGGRGALRLADYEALGRIKGSIEAAVEGALTAAALDASGPRDRDDRLTLLRRGLIPWLAGIDADTGTPRRRVARLSEIPVASRPLIHQLVEQRLLSTDVAQGTGEPTVEPAHEALLRQWGLLQTWLDEDFGALSTLDGVKRAARDWASSNKAAAWLTHGGARLQEAERMRMRDDLVHHIEPAEQDYLAECRRREHRERHAEEQRLVSERRSLRRVRWALVAFAIAVLAALGGALWQSHETSKREAAMFASQADASFRAGLCDRALRMTMAGLPTTKGAWVLAFRSTELDAAVARYATAHDCLFRLALQGHTGPVLKAAFSADGARAVTASADHTALVWDASSGARLSTLTGHAGPVNSAAFSPDGSRVVTASDDGTARVWDASTGATLAVLTGHRGPVNDAVFAPDGSRILTASDDRTAAIWDAKSGKALATLAGHGRRVRTAAFSPDGTRIATASNDQSAALWDAATGQLIAKLAGHRDWVRAAVFNADGRRIVTVSEDKTARLWDGTTGEPLLTLAGHAGYVVSAAFSADGSRLVTASFDKTARIWDASNGAVLAVLSGHAGRLNSAAFSPDGRRVATASEDRTGRLWDAATGALIATFSGHEDAIVSAVFDPSGSRVLTASFDKTSRLWDARSGETLLLLSGHADGVQAAAFSRDGRRIVTAAEDKTARLWDGETGALVATLAGHSEPVRTAEFNADGSRIVTASFDNTARLWDGETGALLAILPHKNLVRNAVFSPDAARIVTVSNDDTAQLWDGRTGAPLAALIGHKDRIYDGTFSPDSALVATAGYDNARLWDARTGALLAVLEGHADRVNSVAFSPDGARLVTSSEDKTARLWDVRAGTLLAVLAGHTDASYSARFSPDGARIVTASFDNTARVWDGKTGAAVLTLVGHGGPVNSVAFSPDGTRIVTASFDNTARVWNAATGAVVMALAGHGGPVNFATFSADGTRIVTASGDKTARVWDGAAAPLTQLATISRMRPPFRQDYVCDQRLIGAGGFTDVEMRDPILTGRSDLRHPCQRFGPLSTEYYRQMLTRSRGAPD
jgi:WD40 repeat protein